MNELYQGLGCQEFYRTLNILPNQLLPCCLGAGVARRPELAPFEGGEFPLERYLERAAAIVAANRENRGDCRGCLHLRPGTYPAGFSGFQTVVLNHFTRCNLHCCYCAYGRPGSQPAVTHNPLPLLRDLQTRGLLTPEADFNIGGGEPSIHEHLEEIVNFLSENNYNCSFCSNAVVFSQPMADFIKRTKNHITVALDSGTPAGFRRVKGRDHFNKVCDNIIKYAEYGSIRLKYIVSHQAADPEDIQGFLRLADRVGALVRISPDLLLYNNSDPNTRSGYRTLLMDFASRLYRAAGDLGLDVKPVLMNDQDAAAIVDGARNFESRR